VRATDQTGVRIRGSGVGWVGVFAVLTALAIQLSVLTASASAEDPWLVAAAQDEPVAAPLVLEDGATPESPAADPVAAPVPDPEVTSPEPVAPSGLPATVKSPAPDAADPALPPSLEVDPPDVKHVGEPTGPAESSPPTTHQVEGTTPADPEPVAPLPTAADPPLTPVLPSAPESRPRGAAPKRSRTARGLATVAWGRPGSLVSGVTVHAWGAAVKWRPPPVSLPAGPRAKSSAVAGTEASVGEAPPEQPPHVPLPPSSSMCGGTSSCGSTFLAMLPLLMGIVCLCASLFERLIEAPALWRPTRFVSLRERPG
jgi:hypothetical protein